MTPKRDLSRRQLLAIGATASAGAALGLSETARAAVPQVPRRVLGRTQASIPILLLGGGDGFKGPVDSRIKVALEHGVNYIDTARGYAHGASERNAAATINRLGVRNEVWITSKTKHRTGPGLVQDVALSLDTMKTSWVDLYFLHALDEVAPLDDKDLLRSVERLKKEKKIRFFGFSCHGGNVAELLHAAAKRSYVDAVMFKYSFRDYGNETLNRAIDAAHAAGVGLIAMKTQGSEAGIRDAWKKFEKTGKWSKHQAVLKAVWEDSRITAAVSHMTTLEQLRQNIAAAVDDRKLGARDHGAIRRYAVATRAFACDGCDHLCGAAVEAPVHIATTLRCLMYHDAYDDPEKARRVFQRLPTEARRLAGVDFSRATAACPHGLDVALHMRRAAKVLA